MNSYRLQLTQDQGFAAAAGTLHYLYRLGVTVAYTSPFFVAGSGGSGYDVCDYTRIQPELGGDEGLRQFCDALQEAKLGHLIDLVPNHMGVDPIRNPWWRDVLQHGAQSRFAGYFDIDWDPVKPELRGRILLPVLDKPYGAALSDREIRLGRENGEYVVYAGSQSLPVRPGSVPEGTVADALTFDELHLLLERQVYRLAHWRTASDEINYRRFFDIEGLVGLRVEEEEVFRASHERVADLIDRGHVTGVRVDHPDGLARPAEYFRRLRALGQERQHRPLHVVAEKILTEHERLPGNWCADGTTGYEFLNLVGGLFVHSGGAQRLRRIYSRVTRRTLTFQEECYRAKKTIMATTMASEVQMLASRLNRISERDPRSRDFTLNSLRRALMEIVACLPVYRTYVTADGGTAEDVAYIRRAAAAAVARNPALEASVFRFIVSVVLTPMAEEEDREYPPADGLDASDRMRFTERLQQFTGSVFAKGVEDTAFYRYHPLLSLNEVGGDAGISGRSPSAFHSSSEWRATNAPRGLLATSTHDTKLGEDARARISVLSEVPDEWARMLGRWRRMARGARARHEAARIVDTNDVYRFYQAVVGTFPLDVPAEDLGAYTERIVGYMRKAIREAKIHTSWLNPNVAYEAAMSTFVTESIARLAAAPTDAGYEFVHGIARAGVVNSLAQLVLKIGAPGVVDIYQGSELWNLSLVDPDNRRPVDFSRRQQMLDTLEPLLCRAGTGSPDAAVSVRSLLDEWPSGAIKLFVTVAGLRLRREHPDVFIGGRYEALTVDGPMSDHVVAYGRSHHGQQVLVAVPRFVRGLMADGRWPLGEAVWGQSTLVLPADGTGTRFRNVLTGERLEIVARDGRQVLPIAELFQFCPVAIVKNEERQHEDVKADRN